MCDNSLPMPHVVHECPCPFAFCFKCMLLAGAVAFIILIPLETNEQSTLSRSDQSNSVCCLCKIYKGLIMFACKLIDIIDSIICGVLNTLYEVKLMLYGLLEKIDGQDLCTFTCHKAVKKEIATNQAGTSTSSPRPSYSAAPFIFKTKEDKAT